MTVAPILIRVEGDFCWVALTKYLGNCLAIEVLGTGRPIRIRHDKALLCWFGIAGFIVLTTDTLTSRYCHRQIVRYPSRAWQRLILTLIRVRYRLP